LQLCSTLISETSIPGLLYPSLNCYPQKEAITLTKQTSKLNLIDDQSIVKREPNKLKQTCIWRQKSIDRYDDSSSLQFPKIESTWIHSPRMSNSVQVRRINRNVLLIRNEILVPKSESISTINLPPIQSSSKFPNRNCATQRKPSWANRDSSSIQSELRTNLSQSSRTVNMLPINFGSQSAFQSNIRKMFIDGDPYRPFGKFYPCALVARVKMLPRY
jgi:hypothetical protein